MSPEPDTHGIGTPPSEHPAFAPPSGPPAFGPPSGAPTFGASSGAPAFTPPGSAAVPPTGWAPPNHGTLVEAPPPSGRRPRHQRRSRRTVVAAVLVGGLLLVAGLSALPMLSATAPTTNTGTGPVVVTASPSPAGTAAATVAGGGVGTPVTFTATTGAGSVTVTSAVWTDAGKMVAPTGQRYLVLDVTVACDQGKVGISPLDLLVVAGTTKVLPGFGAELARPLGGSVLTAGSRVSGQVGYAVPPGPVTLYLLDENLHRLAAVEIPAP